MKVYGFDYGLGGHNHKQRSWKSRNGPPECFSMTKKHKQRLWRTINAPFWRGRNIWGFGVCICGFLGDSRLWRFASLLLCGGGWCLGGVSVRWCFPFNGVLGVSFGGEKDGISLLAEGRVWGLITENQEN